MAAVSDGSHLLVNLLKLHLTETTKFLLLVPSNLRLKVAACAIEQFVVTAVNPKGYDSGDLPRRAEYEDLSDRAVGNVLNGRFRQ
jgi:hypothetical protein